MTTSGPDGSPITRAVPVRHSASSPAAAPPRNAAVPTAMVTKQAIAAVTTDCPLTVSPPPRVRPPRPGRHSFLYGSADKCANVHFGTRSGVHASSACPAVTTNALRAFGTHPDSLCALVGRPFGAFRTGGGRPRRPTFVHSWCGASAVHGPRTGVRIEGQVGLALWHVNEAHADRGPH